MSDPLANQQYGISIAIAAPKRLMICTAADEGYYVTTSTTRELVMDGVTPPVVFAGTLQACAAYVIKNLTRPKAKKLAKRRPRRSGRDRRG